MRRPELEDQLLRLSPRSKIVLGFVLAGVGAVVCVLMSESGVVAGAAILMALVGPVLSLIGLREHARAKVVDAEVERAFAEWSELRRGVEAAQRGGGNVARYLQAKGYQEFFVRRWIATELDPGKDESAHESAATELPEASMTLDLEELTSCLFEVLGRLQGFAESAVETIAREVAAMPFGGEKEWRYSVTWRGVPVSLVVFVFRDDVDAVELSLFSDGSHVRQLQEQLWAFRHRRGK